jgi:hypothetical protein
MIEKNRISRRGTGVAFCGIAAFLMGMTYVGAAIFGTGEMRYWPDEIFNIPIVVSWGLLVLGLVYLVWGELKNEKS